MVVVFIFVIVLVVVMYRTRPPFLWGLSALAIQLKYHHKPKIQLGLCAFAIHSQKFDITNVKKTGVASTLISILVFHFPSFWPIYGQHVHDFDNNLWICEGLGLSCPRL